MAEREGLYVEILGQYAVDAAPSYFEVMQTTEPSACIVREKVKSECSESDLNFTKVKESPEEGADILTIMKKYNLKQLFKRKDKVVVFDSVEAFLD